jgi:hypothetical protein
MVTPTKEEIERRAKEIWFNEQFKNGIMNPNNPEIGELKECGAWSQAVSELMRDNYKAQVESKDYMENFDNFQFDVKEALDSGVYTCGTRGSGKTDLNVYIAEKLMNEGITVLVFDPSQDWQKRSNIPNFLTVQPCTAITIPNESMIYDLSLLTLDQARNFVENFNRELFNYQVRSDAKQWFFCIYEEAHQYFYQGCLRSKNMQYTVRLLTQGRNYKISMALITQFSSNVDKNAIKCMTQRFFGLSNEPNDLEYLKAFLGSQVETLKTLENGSFIYYNRGKISKISIEPYENPTPKTQISTKPIEPIQPLPKQQADSVKATVSLIQFCLWLLVILIALGQLRG